MTKTTNERFIPEYLPYWVEFRDFDYSTAMLAIEWCNERMQETFDWTIHPKHTDDGQFMYAGVFFFLDERDAAFFTLKWL